VDVRNLCFDPFNSALSEFDGVLVRDVPRAEVLKLLHLALESGDVVEFPCTTNRLDIIPRVTEELSCLFAVVLVVSKAEPTELVLAALACHVHASLILLDARLTLGAGLCVDFNPVLAVILLISTNTIEPMLQQLTVNRRMRRLQAPEAEVISTVAKAVGSTDLLYLNDVLAVLAGTPLRCFRKVYIRLIQELLVFLKKLF